MPAVRVTTGARLHFGFTGLSLAHDRLYGGLGLTLDEPRLSVVARPAETVDCDDSRARGYAERAVALLGLSGVAVDVERELPAHVGLGSGTATALAVLAATARAHGEAVDPRALAPDLGRGGRSGVGVAAFERGGAVVDAGHPTALFTGDRPERGEWSVPPVACRHPVPDDWRFLLVVPDVKPGRSGDVEDRSMREAVRRGDGADADRVAGVVVRRLLPALAEGAVERFGAAVAAVGRLNGSWYADEQGGLYRPPVGEVVASLAEESAVSGAGQSSWGPTAYGVTDAERADAARAAGERALVDAGVDGRVRVVAGRNEGRRVERADRPKS